jgi:hypothetical protein
MYLKKVRLNEVGIVIWFLEIQERLCDVILRVMGNCVSALKEKFCDFSHTKSYSSRHMLGKLCGFIHYNVQHVVFIGTCITSNWQSDIRYCVVNFKCQNVISIVRPTISYVNVLSSTCFMLECD